MFIPDTATGSPRGQILSGSDFITRTNDHHSAIRFEYGQSERFCRVRIIDDSLYEDIEWFKVILNEPIGGKLGEVTIGRVIIQPDPEDGKYFLLICETNLTAAQDA